VKIRNSHSSKIDMVKFDGMNNFGMWRCEVIDALTASNLENALLLEEKSEKTSTKNCDKMNRAACDITRSTRYQVPCDDRDFNEEDMGDPR